MFCPHCGAKINETDQYCLSCGTTLSSPRPSQPPKDTPVSATEQPTVKVEKKPMPFWFKLVTFLAVLALIGVTWGILFTESLVDVVDHQLTSLREGDINKAYYNYTSQDFQNTTSFDKFKDFVEAYPIFTQNHSANFTQRSIENHVGTLKGQLSAPDHVNIPIEYKVIKENGKWKILSIRLLKPKKALAPENPEKMHDLTDIIRSQIQAIENQKIDQAYNTFSSDEFKQTTSLEDFHAFIKRYPIISHHDDVEFHKPIIKKDVSSLSVILKEGNNSGYLKYVLAEENGSWKIWSMRILSPTEEKEEKNATSHSSKEKTSTGPSSIEIVAIGTEVDEDGVVKKPKTLFTLTHEDLFAGIETKNGAVGDTLTLTLEHVESGQKSKSMPIKLEEAGNTYSLSVFSPPAEGWPKGHYKLLIQSSQGPTKTVEFQNK